MSSISGAFTSSVNSSASVCGSEDKDSGSASTDSAASDAGSYGTHSISVPPKDSDSIPFQVESFCG